MEYVKFYIGSSIKSLSEENDIFYSFIFEMNKRLNKNVKIHVTDLSIFKRPKDGQTNHTIGQVFADNSTSFFLVSKDLDDLTQAEFGICEDQFSNFKTPRIIVMFKSFSQTDELTDSAKSFEKHLREDLGYYYEKYDNLDQIKLRLIFEIVINSNALEVKFLEGKFYINDNEIEDFSEAAFYKNHSVLNRYKKDLSVLMTQLGKEHDPKKEEKAKELSSKIQDLELNLVKTFRKYYESLGKCNISSTMELAMYHINRGDIEKANEILNAETILNEVEIAAEKYRIQSDTNFKEFEKYFNTLSTAPSIKLQSSDPNRFKEVDRLYKKAVELENEFELEPKIHFEYAQFLMAIVKIKESILVAEEGSELVNRKNPKYFYYKVLFCDLLALDSLFIQNMLDAEHYCERGIKYIETAKSQNISIPEEAHYSLKNNLGLIYMNTQRFDKSGMLFADLINNFSENLDLKNDALIYSRTILYINLGIVYLQSYRLEDAQGLFNKALEMGKLITRKDLSINSDFICKQNLAVLYLSQGLLDQFTETYLELKVLLKEINKIAPQSTDALQIKFGLLEGTYFLANGKPLEAKNTYENIVVMAEKCAETDPLVYNPLLLQIYNAVTQLYSLPEMGNKDKVIEYLKKTTSLIEKLVELNPTVYEPALSVMYMNLAALQGEDDELSDTESLLRKAIKSNEKNLESTIGIFKTNDIVAHNDLGFVLYSEEKYEEALEEFQFTFLKIMELEGVDPSLNPMTYIKGYKNILDDIGDTKDLDLIKRYFAVLVDYLELVGGLDEIDIEEDSQDDEDGLDNEVGLEDEVEDSETVSDEFLIFFQTLIEVYDTYLQSVWNLLDYEEMLSETKKIIYKLEQFETLETFSKIIDTSVILYMHTYTLYKVKNYKELIHFCILTIHSLKNEQFKTPRSRLSFAYKMLIEAYYKLKEHRNIIDITPTLEQDFETLIIPSKYDEYHEELAFIEVYTARAFDHEGESFEVVIRHLTKSIENFEILNETKDYNSSLRVLYNELIEVLKDNDLDEDMEIYNEKLSKLPEPEEE